MNALTLLGLVFAVIVTVSCTPHSTHHHRVHRMNKNVVPPTPNSIAGPQILKAQRLRVPENVRQHLVKNVKNIETDLDLPAKLKRHLKIRETEFRLSKAGQSKTSDSSVTVPFENWHDYLLIANVTVGTPPQSLRVSFAFDDPDLYVVGAGANESNGYSAESASYGTSSSSSSTSSSSESVDIGRGSANSSDKNTYDAGASTTSSPRAGSFSAEYYSINGSIVNDYVNLAGLNLNVTFGDVSTYDYWFANLPTDGFFGLAPSPSNNGLPNVLQQIAGQLDKPIVVLHTYRNYSAYYNNQEDPLEVNEIAFGTDDVPGCGSDWSWHPIGQIAYNTRFANVNSTSISIETGSDGCQNGLDSSHRVFIRNYFNTLYCSTQMMDLLVQASGAQYNTTLWEYIVPCDQVSKGRNVLLGLVGGGSITLTPNDYVSQVNGRCFLNAYGWYDERDTSNNQYGMLLGQQFLNNHCVAYNVAENTLGISNIPAVPSV